MPGFVNTPFSALEPTEPCFFCKQPSSKLCSGCANARYCSAACQKKDWKARKLVCKAFANQEPRPTDNYFRAIKFPSGEPAPRFIWVEYKDPNTWISNKTAPHLGDGFIDPISHDGCPNHKREHDFRLGIWCRDQYVGDEGRDCAALDKLLGEKMAMYFCGSFVAHGYEKGGIKFGDEDEDGKPVDLDTAVIGTLLRVFKAQAARPGQVVL